MTLAEIARLAGVSRTTASYVVNGQAQARRISPQTVERVMAVVQRHHYRIDAQAAALRRGESRTLGFMLPDLENASYARLAKLLERGARERDYQLFIVCSDDIPDTERELARMLKARRVDALITASCLAPDDPFYRELTLDGFPVIGVDRALDTRHFASVVSNNADAASQLTRAVLEHSPRDLLWLDALPELEISRERAQGMRSALETHQSQTPLEATTLHAARYERAAGAEALRGYLAHSPMPEAIVTASYTLMDGVLDVLFSKGPPVNAPRAMASFGDDRLLDFLPLPIHSLPQCHQRIADTTLTLALAAIQSDITPGLTLVERELRRR
ncbi:catabolite repressor/activator [Cobetia marina]|jgi:LacI family fructose operon transcriptional repressor|uniref:Catabolite repressor/activator n=1 Tax=Cobetia marina TaxID=28258 RepID=A0ABU9GI74_COBMA|nr:MULTISPECIES: catabolite repressor/activator [Cobetia]AOM00473.1 DNA-binding transcriptional regulator FruR [Cobetia marina]AZV30564.1 catabolite repressor/activator [Cobetia sp. ICG0124]MDA5564738.1 catabolite repressor/activator [Cobetia sp. MMG027]MDH2292666.1 catabolite repressor/activator [Cobetia sp. 10Alg 146]MDH2372782.1 catabolite repressor/activator [Cobetia sp. 3AK]